MDVLTQILSFVQGTTGKALLLYGFGWLLKINPKFADSAIPAATVALNILVTIIAVAAEAQGVKTASFVVAATPPGFNVLTDVILPQIIADGAYNWPKKLWAFLEGILSKKRRG